MAAITQLFKPEWAEAAAVAALSGKCKLMECGKKVNVCVCEGRRHAGLHEVHPQVVFFTPNNPNKHKNFHGRGRVARVLQICSF